MQAYEIAVLAVYALAVSWLAGILTARGGRLGSIGFLPVYAGVLTLVCSYAAFVLAGSLEVEVTGRHLAAGLALGSVAGLLAIKGEDIILRRARRVARDRGAIPAAATVSRRSEGARPGLALLLLVAALEEVLYRGALLHLSLSLPGEVARFAAVVALALVFAATHLSFGWIQVAAKLPLAFAATAVALVGGGIFAAVIAHGLVNARSWRSLNGDRG